VCAQQTHIMYIHIYILYYVQTHEVVNGSSLSIGKCLFLRIWEYYMYIVLTRVPLNFIRFD